MKQATKQQQDAKTSAQAQSKRKTSPEQAKQAAGNEHFIYKKKRPCGAKNKFSNKPSGTAPAAQSSRQRTFYTPKLFRPAGLQKPFPQSECPPPSHGTAKQNRDTFEDIRAVTSETPTINTTTPPCCIKTHAGATQKRKTNPPRTSGTNSQMVPAHPKRHRVSKTLYIQRRIIRKLKLTQQT